MKFINNLIRYIITCSFFFQPSYTMAECPALSIDAITEVWNENMHTKDISIEGVVYKATVGLNTGQTLDDVGQVVAKKENSIQNECDYILYPIGISRNNVTGWASLKQK